MQAGVKSLCIDVLSGLYARMFLMYSLLNVFFCDVEKRCHYMEDAQGTL